MQKDFITWYSWLHFFEPRKYILRSNKFSYMYLNKIEQVRSRFVLLDKLWGLDQYFGFAAERKDGSCSMLRMMNMRAVV